MTQVLKYYLNNKYVESKTDKFYEVYNPSTGELHAVHDGRGEGSGGSGS